ncbi:ABC transporter permease subunit [Evansella sp. AB-P1]|uniref:ABC transporter permease subunit n=1 Tax=Evansella sp. AB-P1 TaxID=3037653 RepID=UPI00241F1B6A|nr:ABC transporter permease subunit [Evansella sp. AB-P1]MDG5789073.1 ABC transporter permease subunit [Evansella sp. AB-P1]
MFKHECYKIFTKKSIYIVFFLIVLTMIYANNLPTDMIMKEEIYEELYETFGGPVTEEKGKYVREKMRESDAGELVDEISSRTFEDKATGEVHFSVALAHMIKEQLNERKNILESKIENSDKSSYEYKDAEKELTMLNQIDNTHGFYLIRMWQGMFDFIEPATTVIFLSVLIILGLTPVFSDEYTKRTAGLILATKHGKRKIITAKIMAAITYIVIVITSLHLVNGILKWIKHGGIDGWNAPIQGLSGGIDTISMMEYAHSPYDLAVWELYGLTFFLQFIGAVVIAIMVLFVSVNTKNSMIALFISGAIIGIPFMISQIGLDRGIIQHLANFNYSELIKAAGLFEEYITYNIFGQPILYPTLLFSIFGIITALLLYFTYYQHRNYQVKN